MSSAIDLQILEWHNLVQDICSTVGELTGNVMGDKQKTMVESRMKRRLSDLKISSPQEYRKFWKANLNAENSQLISLLTTHFTSFFREFAHFEWIANELPLLVAGAKKEGRSTLKFWSAASSRGQEVWSLCMWLNHHMPKIDPAMNWIIYGTDIDPMVVNVGINGVYHRRELETAPRYLWQNCWQRGKDAISDWYKIKNEFKSRVKFQTMNLLDLKMASDEKFDVIMCRNVFIYFERYKQDKIVLSLLKHLTPQGVLITGLSESFNGNDLPIRGVAPSIYRQSLAPVIEISRVKENLTIPVPMRILCVDDSPTVITILKKILKAPQFEVVGVASNGEEALRKYEELKPDAITLDLHMPIMDGLDFLRNSKAAKSTPVVVVSAVARDHAQLMIPLNEEGVEDFVEKPTLSNMEIIGEELSQKLRMAWTLKKTSSGIRKKIELIKKQRAGGHVVFNVSLSDKEGIFSTLRNQTWAEDELSFMFKGSHADLEVFKSLMQINAPLAKKINFTSHHLPESRLPVIWFHFKGGDLNKLKIFKKEKDFIILEELSINDEFLKNLADDIAPVTSFAYLVDKLLGAE